VPVAALADLDADSLALGPLSYQPTEWEHVSFTGKKYTR
jgi:hypothetical protein